MSCAPNAQLQVSGRLSTPGLAVYCNGAVAFRCQFSNYFASMAWNEWSHRLISNSQQWDHRDERGTRNNLLVRQTVMPQDPGSIPERHNFKVLFFQFCIDTCTNQPPAIDTLIPYRLKCWLFLKSLNSWPPSLQKVNKTFRVHSKRLNFPFSTIRLLFIAVYVWE